jgi:hypothetical protein
MPGGLGVRAGGAEPVEFGPIGIRLLFGAGAQVGAQFLAFAGGVGAGYSTIASGATDVLVEPGVNTANGLVTVTFTSTAG